MTKQEQDVAGKAVAIQSGRDTTILQGLSSEDMKQIIEALSAQIPTYTAIAREIVDVRLTDFEDRLLERFADTERARSDAFKDPDFQYLLVRAQHAYARSGDVDIRDTLVDLIAQRSKQTDRNRLALSLNEAVEKAAVLTINEFAELSLVYLLAYTRRPQLASFDQFVEYLKSDVCPILPNVSEEPASYTYLQAQGCASVDMRSRNLVDIWKQLYCGFLSKGFTEEQLTACLPDGHKNAFDNTDLVRPCLHDTEKLQLNAVQRDFFLELAAGTGLNPDQINNVWNMFANTVWSEQDLIANVSPHVPEIGELFRLWKNTPLNNLQLTSVGIAIAHANLAGITGFDADLSIWIK